MDPRHLLQLAAILDKGSLTAAAQQLGVTQSTLTRNMATLEMQAGNTLFARSRFGVRSTPMGEELAREGRLVQQTLDRSAERIAAAKLGIENHLHIGIGPLIGMAMAPQLVRSMWKAHPDLSVSVTVGRPSQLVERLRRGEFDLLIAPSTYEHAPQGIARSKFMSDQLGIFCGPSHPLANRFQQEVVCGADLVGCPWLNIGFTSPFEDNEINFLSQNGVHERRVELATVGDATVLLQVLMDGKHLCVLPQNTMALLKPTLPLVELPVAVPSAKRNLYLWSKASEAANQSLQRLAQTAHACVPVALRDSGV